MNTKAAKIAYTYCEKMGVWASGRGGFGRGARCVLGAWRYQCVLLEVRQKKALSVFTDFYDFGHDIDDLLCEVETILRFKEFKKR